MSEIRNFEVIFQYNSNIFKSFCDFNKNYYIMLTRSTTGLVSLFIGMLVLFSLPLFFPSERTQYLWFLSHLSLFILFSISIIYFLAYQIALKFFSIFYTKGLKFIDNKDGFYVIYKNNQEEFINYQDIISINHKRYYVGEMASESLNSLLSFLFFLYHHFSIQFQCATGEKKEIAIPLNIFKIYQALDIIISHIPESKQGNVRVIKGKVTASMESKTSFFGLNINLDKPRGKFILIVFAVVVLALWISIIIFLKR